LGLLMGALGVPSASANNRHFNSLYSEHESSWFFLEELVIKQPKKEIDAWFGTTGALALASGVTGYLTYAGTQKFMTSPPSSTLSKVGSATAGVALGALQFIAFRTYLLDKAERKHLTKMMRMWPQLRDKVPHDVWATLDALHVTWLQDQEGYEGRIEATLIYLKSEIYARFPSRYAANNSPFFTSRNFSFQVSFNLYKALKDIFGFLKGTLF
jgi:hypothetical protein